MGPAKSALASRENGTKHRRRSQESNTGSIPLPTSGKPPAPSTTSVSKTASAAELTESAKRPELSERDVAFLCSQTDLKSDDIVRWHKKFFQDNPSGRLDLAGFCRFYCLLQNKPPERVNAMCEHVFRAFDADRNGYVEFGEFLLGFAICSKGDLRKRLAYAFECYDLDSNGYLTEDEIELVLRSMYTLLDIKHVQDFPPELVAKDLMKKLDTSNDGKVSRDEFINILSNDPVYRNMMNPFP